jgi:hypothetical protein
MASMFELSVMEKNLMPMPGRRISAKYYFENKFKASNSIGSTITRKE